MFSSASMFYLRNWRSGASIAKSHQGIASNVRVAASQRLVFDRVAPNALARGGI
jgi:hypothetical protein